MIYRPSAHPRPEHWPATQSTGVPVDPAGLRARRVALGLTVDQVARAADVSIQSIYNWETGHCWPYRRHAERLALALQTTVAALADPPPPIRPQAQQRGADQAGADQAGAA